MKPVPLANGGEQMNKYLPGNWKSAGVVRADTSHSITGAHTGSAFGIVLLAASILSLPPVMLLTSQAVMAQQETVLEEIIVTARKREENVLEIPESLATFSGTFSKWWLTLGHQISKGVFTAPDFSNSGANSSG